MEKYFKDFSDDSDFDEVNFYFDKDLIGISDNHRMAYYYFQKHYLTGATLLHIDTHSDCSNFRDEVFNELKKFSLPLQLEKFIKYRFKHSCVASIAPVQDRNWIPALNKAFPAFF